MYNTYCRHNYGNGKCDHGCNNADCNWDGQDCVEQEDGYEPDYAVGMLIFIIDMSPDEFREIAADFLRELGTLLRTILTIARDDSGREMIYPFSEGSGRSKRSAANRPTVGQR